FGSAVQTTLPVAAERRRSARRQIPQRLLLRRTQMAAVFLQERLAVAAYHVRHLQWRTRADHGLRHLSPPASAPAAAAPTGPASFASAACSSAGNAPSLTGSRGPKASAASPRPRPLRAGASRNCAAACASRPASAASPVPRSADTSVAGRRGSPALPCAHRKTATADDDARTTNRATPP